MDQIDFQQYGIFVMAALVLAITPGPGLAYVVARTVAGGRAEGFASSFGTAIGGLGHVVAAALGLSVLVAQSAYAFAVIKYVGALYLVYLGIRAMRTGRRSAQAPGDVRSVGWAAAFREGVMVEILNVKTALFFLAFIPHFVQAGASAALQFVLLGAICVALNTSADLAAVLGASYFLRAPAASRLRSRLLSIGSGATLVSLGVYVAVSETKH